MKLSEELFLTACVMTSAQYSPYKKRKTSTQATNLLEMHLFVMIYANITRYICLQVYAPAWAQSIQISASITR